MKKKKKQICLLKETDKKSFFFDAVDFERSCNGKNKYENEWQAKFAADEQNRYHNIKLSWYKCKYCSFWHLTSKY